MTFNFHLNEQMTALLLGISRRFNQIGAAAQAEIGRLKQKEVESQGEITRLLQEIDGRENHETFLEHEIEEKRDKIEELERKNNEQEEEKSALMQQNCELDRYNELLESEIDEKSNKIEELERRLEIEIEEQKPSCPVCLENFDTEARQPYALSCPHMVCAQCLYPALERPTNRRRRRANRNNRGENHPSKRCPVCRTRVNTSLKKICL